jgi:hypothetical protein
MERSRISKRGRLRMQTWKGLVYQQQYKPGEKLISGDHAVGRRESER